MRFLRRCLQIKRAENYCQRIKAYNFKWGKREEPDASDREKILIITFPDRICYEPTHGSKTATADMLTS
jgi:hypothetical protein